MNKSKYCSNDKMVVVNINLEKDVFIQRISFAHI